MSNDTTTLRDLVGLGHEPARLKGSALIMIDCHNTYTRGVMRLTGVEAVLEQAQNVLEMARDLKVAAIHIQHDGGAGSPYDVGAESGAICPQVAPVAEELVIVKQYPNSFVQTELDQ